MSAAGIDILFVYGTLMRASGHPMSLRLASQSVLIGPGRICARLYRIGSYPGAVASDNARDSVHGDVVKLLAPAASLHWLDSYERCDERAAELAAYERVISPVTFPGGGASDGWVYVYRLPVHRARRIPSGRFVRR
jgi:gamma-glutamylcyclotransferase (GGCT)/AIG2-like uncharacterized protein YtfP